MFGSKGLLLLRLLRATLDYLDGDLRREVDGDVEMILCSKCRKLGYGVGIFERMIS